MKIGWVIQHIRVAKKLSLEEVANRICVTPARLQSWESERTSPPIYDVFAISNALGVPAYTLFLAQERKREQKKTAPHGANFYAALRDALARMNRSQRNAIMQFAEALRPNRHK